jgi:hypothetical protein
MAQDTNGTPNRNTLIQVHSDMPTALKTALDAYSLTMQLYTNLIKRLPEVLYRCNA